MLYAVEKVKMSWVGIIFNVFRLATCLARLHTHTHTLHIYMCSSQTAGERICPARVFRNSLVMMDALLYCQQKYRTTYQQVLMALETDLALRQTLVWSRFSPKNTPVITVTSTSFLLFMKSLTKKDEKCKLQLVTTLESL